MKDEAAAGEGGEAPDWRPPPGSPQERALAQVAARSRGGALDRSLRITINFHPDARHEGRPLLEVLAEDGRLRSQFETRTSNGGLSAHPGGDRWHWESRIFGGAYDQAEAADRPKYGALDHRRLAVGGSPRFGSAHFRLREAVLDRSTFCYPDSYFEPENFGVAGSMSLIERALLDDRDALDDYVEAHVHGPLRLGLDVEALVLDPSFRGTATEDQARRLPLALEWHAGFRLESEACDRLVAYRGEEVAELALRLTGAEPLTPSRMGVERAREIHDPQLLKKVWHGLARFGDLSRGA